MKRAAEVELTILETIYYNKHEIAAVRNIVTKLIARGETGVSKAALVAALQIGIETAGYSLAKGKRDDEITGSKKNVDESDGLLVIRLAASNWVDMTIGYALTGKWQSMGKTVLLEKNLKSRYKPCLIITSLEEKDEANNVKCIRAFISQNNVQCLNVAGHREEVYKGFSERVTRLLVKSLVSVSQSV